LIKRTRFRRIFPGWWIVLTGGLLALWGHGFHIYGFSALFKPIASELGFSRATTSIAASLGRLEGGFESPISGWIADRYGPKWIILAGVALMGMSLIAMYFVDSLWAYLLVWGVLLGTGSNIALVLPVHTAIANWFVKKRGTASSIEWMFSGMSGVLVLPLVAWLLISQGWRMTCVVGGVVMILVGLPLVWFFIKPHRPEYYGLLPDGATSEEEVAETSHMIQRGIDYATEVEEVEFTLRQAMRTPAYWLLIIALGIHSASGPSFTIHMVPFLTDTGIEPMKAAGMLSMMIGASIPTRFIAGLFADRVKKKQMRLLLAGACFLQVIGIVAYLLNRNITGIYIWYALYGIGMGAGTGLMFPIRARYFGRKAFGSIGGIATFFMMPLGVATPVYFGWVFDTAGNYIPGFIILASALAFAGFLSFFILPPKPPAQVSEIRKIV